jgi:hypothetical protein
MINATGVCRRWTAAPGNRTGVRRVCMDMKARLILIGVVLLLAGCAPSISEASPDPSSRPRASAAPGAGPTAPASPSQSPDMVPVSGECAYPSASIPDTVMVRDVFRAGAGVTQTCVDRGADDGYFEYLPDPCGSELGVKTSSIVARRAIEVTFDDDPGNADVQTSMYRHTVTIYNSSDAASAYLSSVRAAVRECPTRDLRSWTWKYAIISSTARNLELSVRHIAEQPVEGGVPQQATFRVSVYRSGPRVSVVSDVGWEGHPSLKSAVDALVRTAAEQLDRWE